MDRNFLTQLRCYRKSGRSPCGSVDRNANVNSAIANLGYVAPLAGAWIEMLYKDARVDQNIRRSPCGSVDRNRSFVSAESNIRVAPLAGAWIEIKIM